MDAERLAGHGADAARAAGYWLATVRLTAPGARVVAIGGGTALAWLDLVASPGLGGFFAVSATVLCGWVAARSRREALFTAAVLAPLVFLAAAVLAGLMARGVDPGAGAFVDSVRTLATTAPGLYAATALAAGLAVVRRQIAGPRPPQQPGDRRRAVAQDRATDQDEDAWAAARRSRRSSRGSEKISVSSAERTSSTRG